jgi:hypothetical protein
MRSPRPSAIEEGVMAQSPDYGGQVLPRIAGIKRWSELLIFF